MLREDAWDRAQTPADIEKRARRANVVLKDVIVKSSALKLSAGIAYMRYLDGDKRVLYLGREAIAGDAMARALNDARITLHVSRTHGPPPPSRGGGANFGDAFAILAMQRLAELNGGTFTGNATAVRALTHVDAISRFSYLIGYAPVNPAQDRQYRDVEVKVSRPGVTVHYRHGYYAVEDPDPIELREMLIAERLMAAASYDQPSTDIKLELQATALPRIGLLHGLRVSLRIDSTRLSFVAADSGPTATLHIRIFVGDTGEALVGEHADELTITADDTERARLAREGIPYTARLNLQGPPKYVKVVVYDHGADLLGSTTLTLPGVK
jgi:hypothetical protein